MKNLIFDADGTIWDSAQPVADSWSEVLEKKYSDKLPFRFTKEDMYAVMGKTMTEIADTFFPALSEEEKKQVMQDCMAYENAYLADHPGMFYAGLTDTLKKLKNDGYHCCIVSNCQDGYLEAMLAGNKDLAECIEDTECFGRTFLPKSGSIELLLKRNHIAKSDAVYIGDTAMDEKAADDAGIAFIHAAYGFGTADHPAGVIHAPAELPAVLAQLNGDVNHEA
ncbi:MAG: HAD family hydrolase [Bulleidia sp.]|nr:HAD family hydrolase [Bulleidia sp.]